MFCTFICVINWLLPCHKKIIILFDSVLSVTCICRTLISGSLGSYLLYRFGWRSVFYITGNLACNGLEYHSTTTPICMTLFYHFSYVVGTFGMAWVLFLRYYLMSKQRRKEDILSSIHDGKQKQNGSSKKEPVPWLLLFKSPALW